MYPVRRIVLWRAAAAKDPYLSTETRWLSGAFLFARSRLRRCFGLFCGLRRWDELEALFADPTKTMLNSETECCSSSWERLQMLRCSLFTQDLKDIAVEFQDAICEYPLVTQGKLLRTSLATGVGGPLHPPVGR